MKNILSVIKFSGLVELCVLVPSCALTKIDPYFEKDRYGVNCEEKTDGGSITVYQEPIMFGIGTRFDDYEGINNNIYAGFEIRF